ncbi:MAG: TolC family protein [Candidatus Muirbacterium halophilum]|nr:TolC family protein [Candidatus Muirbacterium halophilum]MCK9474976.1 TolC family protein [Candidatus Muirbacterium halophilum]
MIRIILVFMICFGFSTFSMNLKDTVDFALKNSPEFRKIEINHRKSVLNYIKEKKAFIPTFSFYANDSDIRSLDIRQKISEGGSLSFDYTKDISADSTTKSLSYSQSLWKWKDNSGIISELNYKISEASFIQQKKNFILRVVRSMLSFIKSRERLNIEENSSVRWKRSYDYAVARYEAGSANKFDVINAKLNLMNSTNSILSQKDSVENERLGLNKLIGLDFNENITFEVDIKFIKSPIIIKKKREDILMSELSLKVSEIQNENSEINKKPDIKYSGNKNEDKNGNTSSSSAVSMSFELGKSTDSINLDISELNLELASIAHLDLVKNVELEIRNFENRLKTNSQSINIKEENLKNSEENLKFSEISFQKGLISFIDMQDAQEKFNSEKQQYFNALIDNIMLVLDYVKACGEDVEKYIYENIN